MPIFLCIPVFLIHYLLFPEYLSMYSFLSHTLSTEDFFFCDIMLKINDFFHIVSILFFLDSLAYQINDSTKPASKIYKNYISSNKENLLRKKLFWYLGQGLFVSCVISIFIPFFAFQVLAHARTHFFYIILIVNEARTCCYK